MPKGPVTQTVVVLLEEPIKIADLKPLLSPLFSIVAERADGDFWEHFNQPALPIESKNWQSSGASLLINFLPELNGWITVDAVDRPWPDQMGDPKTDSPTFVAWLKSLFGSYTFPGSLERAATQPLTEPYAKEMAAKHRAFIRIRINYLFGLPQGDATRVFPAEHNPIGELFQVTKIAQTLLEHPKALGYFNPGGQVILNQADLTRCLNSAGAQNITPLDAWCQRRLFHVNERWWMIDTVGNAQFEILGKLDVMDVEVAFPLDIAKPEEMLNWPYHVTNHFLGGGKVPEGETLTGPRDTHWRISRHNDSLCYPPRRVTRFFPPNATDIPALLLPKSTR